MKKTKFALIFLLASVMITVKAQQNNQKGYVIDGNFKNIANNSTIYFQHLHDVDSTMSDKQGNFKFAGVLNEPQMCLISVKNRNNRLVTRGIWMANANITVRGNADSIYYMKVTGSPDQQIFEAFEAYTREKMNPYYVKYHAAAARKDSVGMVAEKKSADAVWGAELNRLIAQEVADHPASPVSVYYIQVVNMSKNRKLADSLLTIMEHRGGARLASVKDLRTSFENAKKRKDIHVGIEAPLFAQQDINGKMIKLADYKGKYVLLDFWASWCGPCRKENPNVLKAYNKFKDKNFDILAVSVDSKKEEWIKAVNEDHLPWTQVSELSGGNNKAAQLYAVNAIPSNFLIDPSGKIIAMSLRGEDLTKKLEEILGAN